MDRDVLLITAIARAEIISNALAEGLGARVRIAANRRAGLAALRDSSFQVVVVDESLAEGDPGWADEVWEMSGLATPMQVNFAISGAGRLERDVKAALARRQGEQSLARRAAIKQIEDELKSSVTGLLLESELALREPSMPDSIKPKLGHLVELAGAIRDRLCATIEEMEQPDTRVRRSKLVG